MSWATVNAMMVLSRRLTQEGRLAAAEDFRDLEREAESPVDGRYYGNLASTLEEFAAEEAA